MTTACVPPRLSLGLGPRLRAAVRRPHPAPAQVVAQDSGPLLTCLLSGGDSSPTWLPGRGAWLLGAWVGWGDPSTRHHLFVPRSGRSARRPPRRARNFLLLSAVRPGRQRGTQMAGGRGFWLPPWVLPRPESSSKTPAKSWPSQTSGDLESNR